MLCDAGSRGRCCVRRSSPTTSTIGVRQSSWAKYALPRAWVPVEVDGHPVPIKIAHQDGVITQASAEFDAVASVAEAAGRSQGDVLAAAMAAAATAGLSAGRPWPPPES